MIVKNTDFIGRFKIAGAVISGPNGLSGNDDELSLLIDEFEPKCLITVLGYSLYSELKPELLKKPFVASATDTADEKWVNLVNGKDNYLGLKNVLVPYIYYQFLSDDESSHSQVGIVKEKAKGANNFNSRQKAVTAWRAFFEAARGKTVINSIISKQSYVGDITGIIYSDEDDKIWSLYKFLYENLTIYETANPSYLENINIYGI